MFFCAVGSSCIALLHCQQPNHQHLFRSSSQSLTFVVLWPKQMGYVSLFVPKIVWAVLILTLKHKRTYGRRLKVVSLKLIIRCIHCLLQWQRHRSCWRCGMAVEVPINIWPPAQGWISNPLGFNLTIVRQGTLTLDATPNCNCWKHTWECLLV